MINHMLINVYHTAGPQYEATQMDGVPRGL